MLVNQLLRQLPNILFFTEVKRCRRKRISPNTILFPVIWITNRCNLRCKMCDRWKTEKEEEGNELSTREWYSFGDSARDMHAAIITITGGEPFLRQDIFDIIKYFRKQGIASHVCTNGTLLNEVMINKLKDAKLNSISISVDSDCAQLHNEIRGTNCFDIVVNGIKLLRRVMPKLKIGINCVISKKNFRNIYQMVSFAEKLGVNQIKFDPIHTNLMHREKNLSSFDGFLFTKDDLPELRFELNKLIKALSQSKLLTVSTFFLKGIVNLYNGQFRKIPCYAGYISCAIDPFGRVSPCDNFDGNESLRNKSLEEIWKSSSFQRLRQKVHNCTSKCWDTTHTELSIRCSLRRFIQEFGQILKEIGFYFSK